LKSRTEELLKSVEKSCSKKKKNFKQSNNQRKKNFNPKGPTGRFSERGKKKRKEARPVNAVKKKMLSSHQRSA